MGLWECARFGVGYLGEGSKVDAGGSGKRKRGKTEEKGYRSILSLVSRLLVITLVWALRLIAAVHVLITSYFQPSPTYPLCPEPACMNPKNLGGGLAGLSASHSVWGCRPGGSQGTCSEEQLWNPPHTWAGPAAALRRTLNVCAVAGSYLVFGSKGLQIKLYG